jgi:hypothetical protein
MPTTSTVLRIVKDVYFTSVAVEMIAVSESSTAVSDLTLSSVAVRGADISSSAYTPATSTTQRISEYVSFATICSTYVAISEA